MSDDTNNKPTLTRKPLTLSRSLESGEVKQTFSHGRTNKVVVEVKRKKLVGKPGFVAEPEVAAPPPPPPPVAAPVAAPASPAPRPAANDMLSRQERQAKLLREAEEETTRPGKSRRSGRSAASDACCSSAGRA
jgi:translation initiation factor IF-2